MKAAISFLGVWTFLAAGMAGASMQVTQLRCEYLDNPVGIDVTAPRLSWVLESSERGQGQSAYQVLVASSIEKLAPGQADIWDSGQVASDQSTQVAYAGKPLVSGQRCCWTVRVWDKDGKAQPWSRPGFWSMGLLSPEDWKGRWIGYDAAEPARLAHKFALKDSKWIWSKEGDPQKSVPAGTRYFRKPFEIPEGKTVVSAYCVLTADDSFSLAVNGNDAGQGDDWKNAYVLNIASFLKPGPNAAAITVKNNVDGPAAVTARLVIEFAEGEPLLVDSDATWRYAEKETEGWQAAGFDDAAWPRAKVVGDVRCDPWKRPVLGVSGPTQTIPSPLFRKPFQVSKPVAWACVHICGLGFHELYLNGGKVGDHIMDPAFTRYDKRALYVTHNVTELLKEGENVLGVMLGHGWYDMHGRGEWDFDRAPWRDTPRLLAQLEIVYTDGSAERVVSDESWRTAPGPIRFDCIRDGEEYDAREEKPGWDAAGYDDSAWAAARAVEGPKGVLRAQMTIPAKVIETIKPVAVTEPQPGVFVFDMGQNFSGWAQLRVSGPAGTTVTMHYDERLFPDGLVDRRNKVYMYSGDFQTDRFTLKGAGSETWEPRFIYQGFQYVQVEGFPGKPTLDSLRGRVVHIDLPPTGEFACSNELLNKIARNARWSYLSNFIGYPTDCPHREKNGWTGDAHLAAEQALYNFNPAPAYTKWMNDFKDEQPEKGDFPGIVPTSGWGYNIGPAWDSAYLLIPSYMYLYRGDTRILEEHYAGMKRYVDYLGTRAENHIVSYGLGDWVPAKTQTPSEITSTGYYYADARLLARAAALLGKADEAAQYNALADQIRDAFNAKFYDAEKGTYGTQTANGCAIYQGLVAEDQRERVVKALEESVLAYGKHFDGGILGSKYVPRALSDNGRAGLVYDMASQTSFPSWGHWLEQGATTLWENWNGEDSRNHIMFGDIVAWFYSALAGIRPDPENPGFKHIIVEPHLVGDLTWVQSACQTPYGTLSSAWERHDKQFTLKLRIPVNTHATLYLPAAGPAEATESGAPLEQAPGVMRAAQEPGRAVVELGSGDYQFTSVLP